MNRCLCTILIILYSFPLFAQGDSIKNKEDGEIKLSKKFMQELDNAFSFSSIAAPITPGNGLTTEQLHEWVGKPDSVRTDTSRFTKEYFAVKMYLKEFCKPIPLCADGIFIPGITDYQFSNGISKTGISLDANALGAYIRPKEVRVRKLRKLSERSSRKMDKLYPLTDLPLYTKQDTDSSNIFQQGTK